MKYNILCDLDALLDTRLAVYKTMGDETFTKVLNSGWAKVRHTDAVEGTDFELFKKLYAKRDESILQYADVTSVIDFIMDIYKINKGFSMQDKEPPPIVFINTYPYKITEEEEELLLTIIENTGIEHVELISINTAQSGPSLLR